MAEYKTYNAATIILDDTKNKVQGSNGHSNIHIKKIVEDNVVRWEEPYILSLSIGAGTYITCYRHSSQTTYAPTGSNVTLSNGSTIYNEDVIYVQAGALTGYRDPVLTCETGTISNNLLTVNGNESFTSSATRITWTATISKGTGVNKYQYKINDGDWSSDQTTQITLSNLDYADTVTVKCTSANQYYTASTSTAVASYSSQSVTVPSSTRNTNTIKLQKDVGVYIIHLTYKDQNGTTQTTSIGTNESSKTLTAGQGYDYSWYATPYSGYDISGDSSGSGTVTSNVVINVASYVNSFPVYISAGYGVEEVKLITYGDATYYDSGTYFAYHANVYAVAKLAIGYIPGPDWTLIEGQYYIVGDITNTYGHDFGEIQAAGRLSFLANIKVNTGVSSIYYKLSTDTNWSQATSNTSITVDYGATLYWYAPAITGYIRNDNYINSSTYQTISNITENKTISPTATLDYWTCSVTLGTGVSNYQYKIDNGSWSGKVTSATISSIPGTSTITVKCGDASTYYTASSATASASYLSRLVTVPSSSRNTNTITLTKNSNVSSISLTYVNTSGNSVTVTANGTYTGQQGTSYSWSASPATGYNISQASGSGTLTSNISVAPTASIKTYEITVTKNTGVGTIYYKIGSGSWTSTTSSKTFTVNYNSTVYWYATAATGYNRSDSYTSSSSYATISNITSTKTISPTASVKTYTYTTGTLPTGVASITCKHGSTTIANGGTIEHFWALTFTATASTGYNAPTVSNISSVTGSVTGSSRVTAGSIKSYTLTATVTNSSYLSTWGVKRSGTTILNNPSNGATYTIKHFDSLTSFVTAAATRYGNWSSVSLTAPSIDNVTSTSFRVNNLNNIGGIEVWVSNTYKGEIGAYGSLTITGLNPSTSYTVTLSYWYTRSRNYWTRSASASWSSLTVDGNESITFTGSESSAKTENESANVQVSASVTTLAPASWHTIWTGEAGAQQPWGTTSTVREQTNTGGQATKYRITYSIGVDASAFGMGYVEAASGSKEVNASGSWSYDNVVASYSDGNVDMTLYASTQSSRCDITFYGYSSSPAYMVPTAVITKIEAYY